MSSKVVLSLVTPCYKTPKFFLERLFVSLEGFRGLFEWILVDDSPHSPEIIAFYDRARRIIPGMKLIANEANRGIAASYVSGLREASGTFVAILDHDDEVDLRELFSSLDDSSYQEYDLIYTNEAKFNNFWYESYIKPSFDALSAFFYYYPHHLTLFRTNVVHEILEKGSIYPVADTAFDVALWYEYLASAGHDLSVFALPYVAYGWRVHRGSTASFIGQKPKHLTERRKISSAFATLYEQRAFEIENRDDVPYVIRGRFGVDVDVTEDYLSQNFEYDFINSGQGAISKLHEKREINKSLSVRLRSLPLQYLARMNPQSVIVINEKDLRPRGSGHVKDVPYLASVDTLADGRYLRMWSKGSASGVPKMFEILLAGDDN
jgi:glycosyltransferase involved in cell wall biosynthesis